MIIQWFVKPVEEIQPMKMLITVNTAVLLTVKIYL